MSNPSLSLSPRCLPVVVKTLYRFDEVQNPTRMLVLRSSRLGDFICAMPALNRLRREYPLAKILLLTLPSASRLMKGKEGNADWLHLLSPGVVDQIVLFHGDDLYDLKKVVQLRSRVSQFDPEVTFIFPF